MPVSRKVFIAVMDWGLGHATRSIPIIGYFRELGWEVITGGDQSSGILFEEYFPGIRHIRLPAYRPIYGRSRVATTMQMALQAPRFINLINNEHEEIERLAEKESFDLIISDNRFGLYSNHVPSVVISHQLKIHLSGMSKVLRPVMDHLNHGYLNHFDECWVPDLDDPGNLTGRLTHGVRLEVPVKYIGPLSRLEKCPDAEPDGLLILLSGPEPQRSLLESLLLSQIPKNPGKLTLVRGLPGKADDLDVGSGVKVFNHLNAAELRNVICSSSLVICRSGYSTVMDLIRLGKKAIFIPTPGQTEQEYLAWLYKERKWFYTEMQSNFKLARALDRSIDYQPPKWEESVFESFRSVIKDFLTRHQLDK